MRVIAIIGSRNFKHKELITSRIQTLRFNCNPNETLVISGGAGGVDSHAIQVAAALNLQTKEILPDFSKGYDVREYHRRNDVIVEEVDKVIAFWDGESKGTKSVIEKALQKTRTV